MRLIDADKIDYIMEDDEKPSPLDYARRSHIADEPTVKAIPIEWIKNWCMKNYPTYPRIITEQLLKKTETWRMLEDWEKENGGD